MSDPPGPAVDGAGVIADLRELDALTGGPDGARRLCWGPVWREAREWLGGKLAELGIEPERDEAGNLWARLAGTERERSAVAVGSHIDSVPAGGWLDGALGVVAGLGILRAYAEAAAPPSRDLLLVDFADEEGARFGRSLVGSSIASGTLDPLELAETVDSDGGKFTEVLAANGVELAAAPAARSRLEGLGAYLELHIEQGPILEAEGIACAAVSGCAGIERHRLSFRGQAGHAGTTPMDARRDAGLAAAATMLAADRIAREHGGFATCGSLDLDPGIVTAVPGRAELSVDLRHAAAEPLADMLSAVLTAAAEAADERRCVFGGEPIWRIAPTHFDPALVELARRACAARGGRELPVASGALHDAAEVSRRVPTAMIFCASVDGISHAKEEDSRPEDLLAAVDAFGRLVTATLESR